MKSHLPAFIVFIACFALSIAGRASAHISYTGRNFGVLQGGNTAESATITIANISSDFGWAASTDANYGDSHRTRAFRFQLASAGIVTLAVQATGGGFLPGFSVYSGLSHVAPELLAHDATEASLDYLATLSGPAKLGALFGLGDWAIGNDPVYNTPGDPSSGVAVAASLRYFDYVGNAADGTTANHGIAAGINGDGAADGFVTGTFNLLAGDYSIFVGGANLAGEGPGPYPIYGSIVTVSVIPEPSSALLIALSGLTWRRRRA